ncbi:unnamed protein product [marine sediment metagenome]|uniref:Uncharacterized protein n=1 Tax=marine sediment metagenome TaxID=412755 RepID=X1CVP2_9ZZZZ
MECLIWFGTMKNESQYDDDPSVKDKKSWQTYDYHRRVEIAKNGQRFEKKEPDNLLRAVLEMHSEFSMLLVEIRRLNNLLYQLINKME